MIAVDTNILIYAHREDSPFHDLACRGIEALACGSATWAIPWPCLHEFLAIATHRRVFDPPTPIDLALDQVDAWLESPSLVLISESKHHWSAVSALAKKGRIVGPKIHDARVAALCLQHGVDELWSADRDFSLFPELRTINPCAG